MASSSTTSPFSPPPPAAPSPPNLPPSASASSSLSSPNSTNSRLLYSFLWKHLSQTNSHISHVNRLISSTAHLDTLLSTLSYILTLLHSVLLRSNPSVAPLKTLISELRITLRLFGLLSIYTWGVSTVTSPPADLVLRWITRTQVGVNVVFQALENGAFLAEKGVLRWGRRRRAKAWVWSSRAWMAHVGLEGIRLMRVWALRERERQRERETRAEMREVSEFGREGDGNIVGKEMAVRGDKVKGEDEKWWRDVTVNSAYAPMTVHWSLEEGLLGETWIGALGLLAGLVGFRQAWKETA